MPENWEQLKTKNTASLIDLIRARSTDNEKTIAEDAFHCLCFRFQTEIISNIRVVVCKWGYDCDVADEIAFNALDRFWKYPKFESSKCNTSDIDNCFIFYIHKICRRLLINYNKNINIISDTDVNEEIIFEFPYDKKPTGSENKAELTEIKYKIEEAISQLGPKHKVIFLTYKAYEQTGRKLSRNLLKKLRTELKLSQNTIRFYKNEANEKIQKIINEYGK